MGEGPSGRMGRAGRLSENHGAFDGVFDFALPGHTQARRSCSVEEDLPLFGDPTHNRLIGMTAVDEVGMLEDDERLPVEIFRDSCFAVPAAEFLVIGDGRPEGLTRYVGEKGRFDAGDGVWVCFAHPRSGFTVCAEESGGVFGCEEIGQCGEAAEGDRRHGGSDGSANRGFAIESESMGCGPLQVNEVALALKEGFDHLFGSAGIDGMNAAPLGVVDVDCVTEHGQRLPAVIREEGAAFEHFPLERGMQWVA